MEISIDLISIVNFLLQDPLVSLGIIIKSLWWLLPVYFIPYFIYEWRLNIRKEQYEKNLKPILLAVDVPQELEPNLKAVEQIFAQLAGIQTKGTLYERFFKGEFQPRFSLEIISVEGYVQFLFWTPAKFRDLIEAAIYAQYPDAEITEVEDYTKNIPFNFSRKKYTLWGTEFRLQNKDVFPIRTYPQFEYSLSQQLADPMAALLEILSKLKKGEQIWIQLVISPVDDKWKKRAKRVIEQIISGKKPSGPLESILDLPGTIISGVVESFTWISEGAFWQTAEEDKKDELLIGGRIMNLTPGEKGKIESIEMKISKLGFRTKFRMVYFAQNEVYEKGRGSVAVIGAIKQFNTLNLNGFKSDKKIATRAHYLFVKHRLRARERRVLRRFKKRYGGEKIGYILNTEELASVYHFPTLLVKAPLVKKAEAKRGGPPATLPISDRTMPSVPSGFSPPPEETEKKAQAPDNLPT